jgi:hypothetical protein
MRPFQACDHTRYVSSACAVCGKSTESELLQGVCADPRIQQVVAGTIVH